MHATDAPAACDNCATALQGRYCHVCGQAAANPLRHVGHAIEEFFESFWHLDGRVFRTLRELFAPGRVACNYLAGHRARYIAPLRLFIVLTVLTFFVGRLIVEPSDAPVAVQMQLASGDLTAARTTAEVERQLRIELADLDKARRRLEGVPGMPAALDRSEAAVRLEAATRIAQLRKQPAPTAAQVEATMAERRETPEPQFGEGVRDTIGGWLRVPGRAWHERDNPVAVSWLPAFANRALNHRIANIERNTARLQGNNEQFLQAMLGAVPSALFLLVPVFALLLKLVYVGSKRGYLEHLVVALYSHAWLLLVLLALFVLEAVGAALPTRPSGAEAAVNLLRIALWLWVPLYLLTMQKRVYAQGWPITVLKYLLVGSAYLFLLLGVLLYAVFATLMAG